MSFLSGYGLYRIPLTLLLVHVLQLTWTGAASEAKTPDKPPVHLPPHDEASLETSF
ncbi:hypothetical protein D3C73_1552400 [compost metagenome]